MLQSHFPTCPDEPHDHILVTDESGQVIVICTRIIHYPLEIQVAVKSNGDNIMEQTLHIALFLSMCINALLDNTDLVEIADGMKYRISDAIKSLRKEEK